jgi:uncharacterized membrane protein YczE
MSLATIVGWLLLVLSWTIPLFIKDEKDKRMVGAVLAALATGVFMGHFLSIP